jgi:hypothetical protein
MATLLRILVENRDLGRDSPPDRKLGHRSLGGKRLKLPIRALATILTISGILLLAGCPPHTTIANINRDPGRYAGKEVSIAGHVSSSFGALGTGVYEIDDGTGTMWVYSQSYGIPSNGTKVAVTGVIEQGFSFGGRSFATILKETQRRH